MEDFKHHLNVKCEKNKLLKINGGNEEAKKQKKKHFINRESKSFIIFERTKCHDYFLNIFVQQTNVAMSHFFL